MAQKDRGHQAIWISFRTGGEKDFSRFFSAFYCPLFNYGLKLVGDEEFVKDVIQDFFLYLYEHRARLSEQVDSPVSYLLASFRRKLLLEIRRDKARQDRLVTNQRSVSEVFVIGKEDIIIKEESEELNKAIILQLLNELSPRQREIIYLKFYQNLSIREIADVFSISYQVVANHLYRALKKLRKHEAAKRLTYSSLRMLF